MLNETMEEWNRNGSLALSAYTYNIPVCLETTIYPPSTEPAQTNLSGSFSELFSDLITGWWVLSDVTRPISPIVM